MLFLQIIIIISGGISFGTIAWFYSTFDETLALRGAL